MIDLRENLLAKILVNHSIRIKKGDIIIVNTGIEAKSLALEVCRLILEKGAMPRINSDFPGFAYTYYKYASNDVLKTFPDISLFEAKKAAGSIGIYTEDNTRELSNIDPAKIALRRKVTKPISDIVLKKDNWVFCHYPTNSLAQDADMSLEEYQDFAFSSMVTDYKKMEREQEKLKKVLDNASNVRIKSSDTDLKFSIKGRKAIKCFGHRNIPDGEVFTSIVEDSTNGYIHYTYPAITGGREVEGIELLFKDGKVIKATAKKNEDYLKKMIKTDKGAVRIGEFGVGFNCNIKKFTKQILYDEKIGGTIHLALGKGYPESLSKNISAIHWDMIKDLRKGGELWLDKKCIQRNGKFLI